MKAKSINERTICLVQITRLGDLIQTYQAARHLKINHPDIKLYLVARESFARPLLFLLEDIFDDVFLLDLPTMLKKSKNTIDLKENLTNFIKGLNALNIDSLINLSWSKSSTYLCSLINANHRFGLFRDRTNKTKVEDQWSCFVHATTMRGPNCPFALVDIYKSIIGINDPTNNLQVEHNPNSRRIVLHPFASNPRKYWKTQKWIEVIYQTLKLHQDKVIVIVGAKGEQKMAEQILSSPLLKELGDRVISKVGKTTIEELFSIISDAAMFIGHDSFVSHLSSLTTIPILTLSLGPARPHETAPYTDNAYVFSSTISCYPCFPSDPCEVYQCHSDIPYKMVVDAISTILSQGELDQKFIKSIENSIFISSMSILKTGFSKSNFLLLTEMLPKDPSSKEAFRIFNRVAYMYTFNEVEEKHPYPAVQRRVRQELEDSLKGIEHINELAKFGKKYSLYILEELTAKEPDIEKIKIYSKKINEIDHLNDLLIQTYPLLKPNIEFTMLSSANLKGTDLVSLTESNFHTYNNSEIISSILKEFVNGTLNKHPEKEVNT